MSNNRNGSRVRGIWAAYHPRSRASPKCSVDPHFQSDRVFGHYAIEVSQLTHALTAKWASMQRDRLRLEELNGLVEERTAKLSTAIEELAKAKNEAAAAAMQDPLTELPNRRLFHNR